MTVGIAVLCALSDKGGNLKAEKGGCGQLTTGSSSLQFQQISNVTGLDSAQPIQSTV